MNDYKINYDILNSGDNCMEIKRFVLGPIQSNCYIVSKDQEALIIDPGFPEKVLIEYLEKNKLTPKFVYLTHGHFDHWGGLKMLKNQYPNLIACAPTKDQVWLTEGEYNRWGYEAPIDQYVDENDKIMFGGKTFNIMETPGHSNGGTILYTDTFAFTGDTLFYQTVGRTDIPFSDMRTLYFSIKRMFNELDDQLICYPGHGRETSIGHEKKYNPFVRQKA